MHWYFLDFSWMYSMWLFSPCFEVNILSHFKQGYVFADFSCAFCTWRLKSNWMLNLLGHSLQWKDLSFSWTLFTWISNCPLEAKVLSQKVHGHFPIIFGFSCFFCVLNVRLFRWTWKVANFTFHFHLAVHVFHVCFQINFKFVALVTNFTFNWLNVLQVCVHT